MSMMQPTIPRYPTRQSSRRPPRNAPCHDISLNPYHRPSQDIVRIDPIVATNQPGLFSNLVAPQISITGSLNDHSIITHIHEATPANQPAGAQVSQPQAPVLHILHTFPEILPRDHKWVLKQTGTPPSGILVLIRDPCWTAFASYWLYRAEKRFAQLMCDVSTMRGHSISQVDRESLNKIIDKMSVAVSSYKDHKERRKHAECKALAMEIMGLSSKYDDKVSESVRQMAEKILAENKVYGVIYTRQMKQASLRDGQVPPVTHFERDRHPKVLAATTAWIKKESWADKAVLWLHGPEGCGKSSICYTLAEELDDMQQLAASYAFKHEDFPANQVDLLNKTFMANLIVDMCEVLKERFRPLVCEHVEQAEAADPDLCKSPLRKQLVKILVPVFKKLNRPSSDPSLVVVIDGIDNAELAARASLLDMIRYSITASLPIRYILASQRNDDLVKHLETGGRLSPHVHSLDVRESPDDNPDTPVAQTPTARSIGPWERVYMPYSGDKQSHQADVQRFDSRFPDDSHF